MPNYFLAKCSVLKASLSCMLLRRCKTSTDVGFGCLLAIKNFFPKYRLCVLEATAVLACTVRSFINIFTILSMNLLYPDLFFLPYPKIIRQTNSSPINVTAEEFRFCQMQINFILSCCNSLAHPFTHLSRFLYLLLSKREENTSVINSNKYTAVRETSALAVGSNKEYSNETGCCYIDGKEAYAPHRDF